LTGIRLLSLAILICMIAGCVPVRGNADLASHPPETATNTAPVSSPSTPQGSSASDTPTDTPRQTSTSTPTATIAPSLTATPSPTWVPSETPLPSLTPTLAGPLIAIDPGHGGKDLGARHFGPDGQMDLTESDINLSIALDLRDTLLSRGFRVLLTRDDDYGLNAEGLDVNDNGEIDHVDEAQARVDLINASEADLLLSIHQNAFFDETGEPATDVGGTVTFYCADRPFSDDSLMFAHLVQEELVAAFRTLGHDVRDRGVEIDLVLYVPGEPGSYLILLGPKTDRIARPCRVPGALSETLFLTHEGEAALAADPQALQAIAKAYADAITRYFEQDSHD